jgi:Protein-tyrosine phosphatase
MKQERKINIFDLVKQLRLQRMKMVQTVDQYAFLYTSGLQMAQSRAQQGPQGMDMNRLIEKLFSFSFPSKVLQNVLMYFNESKLFSRLKSPSLDTCDNATRDRETSM